MSREHPACMNYSEQNYLQVINVLLSHCSRERMKMYELEIEAAIDNLGEVLAFVDEKLEEAGCLPKVQIQIDIAVEEIFVNIAHYAYVPDTGQVKIGLEITRDDNMIITFIDRGKAYDPLKKADPDLTLSADERPIGGLGIYMAKKSMDDMRYYRSDSRNILVLTKKIK